ncbi:hypothetical protein GTA28_11635 [Rhodococcus hoagii]|nr:hypothetical protein [Prescottella equi]
MQAVLGDAAGREEAGGPAALDKALPGWAVDAIADGVQSANPREVWGKCVSIAMSAYRRGWSEHDYVMEIAASSGRLWLQLGSRPDGRSVSQQTAYKALRKAWEYGVANANNVGARSRAEIHADAVELAYSWADRLNEGVDRLGTSEAAVMNYVVAETERRGLLRVTCPRRAIADSAGIGEEAVRGALTRLTSRGLLVKHSPGRRGVAGKGRAAIYGLAADVNGTPVVGR